jgi:hypothetical protein
LRLRSTGRADWPTGSSARIGWGIPEERAKLYESDQKDGGIALGVSSCNDDYAVYFEGEWKGYNGRNIYR